MSARAIILEIDGDRLLAVEARVTGSRVRVLRSASAARPAETPIEDAEAVGAWVRSVLDAGGLGSKRSIIAVSRGQVLTKRLDPLGGDISRAERHEMVRLQMSRQASLTSTDNVIDYIEEGGGRAEGGGHVLAAAMPAERVAWRRAVAQAAGLRLDGILLRSAGVQAVLAGVAEDPSAVLVIAPGAASVEILVLAGGDVVFSRSIDGPGAGEAGDVEAFSTRVAVEASRSVMSFRVSPGGCDIGRVVVVADGDLSISLARAATDRLGMPVEPMASGDLVEFASSAGEADRAAAVPLAGLLLCRPRRMAVLDFANPTAAPDVSAGARQAALAAVLAVIVLGGAGSLLARNQLSRERARLESARTEYAGALSRYKDAMVVGARLGHARAWTQPTIDWMSHLDALIGRMPGPVEGALTELLVELPREVSFAPGKALNDAGAWSAESTMVARVTGVARDRRHAQEFRQRLLDAGGYSVVSQGPEVENRFSMVVTTGRASAEKGDRP